MNKAYLLTGGNLGDRAHTLQQAAHLIEQYCGTITNASGLYETAAWGKTDQPAFLNQALELGTSMEAAPLMERLLAIETELGRHRQEKYGPRVIDIDMLFFNDRQIQTPLLTIPHPEIARRRFALTPLAEIAAGFEHPVLHKTVATLLEECADELPVKKILGN